MQEINKIHFHRNQLVRPEATLVWSSTRTVSAEEIWQRNTLQHMNKSTSPHQGTESNTTESQLRWHVKPALRGIWWWVFLDSNSSNQLCDVQTSLGKWSNEWVKIYLQKQTNKKPNKQPKILITEKTVTVGRYTYPINLCKEAALQKCIKLKYKPVCILLYLDIQIYLLEHTVIITIFLADKIPKTRTILIHFCRTHFNAYKKVEMSSCLSTLAEILRLFQRSSSESKTEARIKPLRHYRVPT